MLHPSPSAHTGASVCPPPAENDTALAVTAPAESGQGVGTLTIDRPGMRDLWLPWYREQAVAAAAMDALCRKHCHAANKAGFTGAANARFEAYSLARTALKSQLAETVEHARDRGALLLLGGVQ